MSRAVVADFEAEFRRYQGLSERAALQVDDAAFFRFLDGESNSIAIIMQHMAGNLRSRFRDFLTSDGEKPDRHRDAEFELPGRPNRAALMAGWSDGWATLHDALASLTDADLGRTVLIRGEPHTVHQALTRALSHQASHAGQVIQLARHWAGPAWQTLSIPRHRSDAFTAGMKAAHGASPPATPA
jgi:hypothetical protein